MSARGHSRTFGEFERLSALYPPKRCEWQSVEGPLWANSESQVTLANARFLFVRGEGFDQVGFATGHSDESATKRHGVPQSGIGADSPEWRHIMERVAKQCHLLRGPRLDRHRCLHRKCGGDRKS